MLLFFFYFLRNPWNVLDVSRGGCFKTEVYVHGWNLGLVLKIGEQKDTYQYSQAEIGSHHFRD